MTKILAILATLFLVSMPAYGFGMLDGKLGQHAEHEQITRLGLGHYNLGPITMNNIAGKNGTAGAVGAPDIITPHKPRAHCDSGDYLTITKYPNSHKKALKRLEKCKLWIFKNLDKAVKEAGKLVDKNGNIKPNSIPNCVFNGIKGRAKCNVLEKLGSAFHASQDFYAHSNWADKADQAAPKNTVLNPLGLSRHDISVWINPRSRQAILPKGLITGCFSLNPLVCKNRARHSALNKDLGKSKITIAPLYISEGKTKRGSINGNFERAVRVAILDTKDKWRYFEERVLETYPGTRGELIICVIRTDEPTDCAISANE